MYEQNSLTVAEQTDGDPPIPPALFEALVTAWTEILVADYLARHPEQGQAAVVVSSAP